MLYFLMEGGSCYILKILVTKVKFFIFIFINGGLCYIYYLFFCGCFFKGLLTKVKKKCYNFCE